MGALTKASQTAWRTAGSFFRSKLLRAEENSASGAGGETKNLVVRGFEFRFLFWVKGVLRQAEGHKKVERAR